MAGRSRLSVDAPPGVIAALLDLANGGSPPSAVRQGLGEPAPLTPLVLSRLVSTGALSRAQAKPSALSPVFCAAAGVLADPRLHVRIRLWTEEVEATTSVYFSERGTTHAGVGLTEAGDGLRLTAPLEVLELLDLVDAGFLSASRATGREFGALLDADAARTLVGILDWIRSGGGEASGGDRTGPVIRFDLDAARSHQASGVARASGVMFAPYILLAFGSERGFDRARWNAAARRLTLAGLITQVAGGYTLGESVRSLGYTVTAITGAFQWEAAIRDNGDGLARQSRIALALGPALLLVFDRADDGLFIHAPSAEALRADVAAFVASQRKGTRPEPPATPLKPAARPPEVDAPARQARFCTKCGKALKPDASFCPSCGAAAR